MDVLPQWRDDHPGRHRGTHRRQLLAYVIRVTLTQLLKTKHDVTLIAHRYEKKLTAIVETAASTASRSIVACVLSPSLANTR